MADDHNARFRSNDPYGNASADNQPTGDPLAELARLIGRNDMFSDFGSSPAPVASASFDESYRFDESTYSPRYESDLELQQRAHDGGRDDRSPAMDELDDSAAALTPAFDPFARAVHQSPMPEERHYDSHSILELRNIDPNTFAPLHSHEIGTSSTIAPAQAQTHRSEPKPYDQESYVQPPLDEASEPYAPQDSYAKHDFSAKDKPYAPYVPEKTESFARQDSYASLESLQSYRHDAFARPSEIQDTLRQREPVEPLEQSYEPPAFAQPTPPMVDPDAFPISPPPFHRGDAAPRAQEFYEDEEQGGRRKGLMTVFAVLCLAVVGTAGAFAYRSMFSGSGSSGPPPVIRASTEPNKIAPPPPANNDQSASKLSYDRFGDRGQNEQVLVREEKPVEPREIVRSSPPRVVLPGAPNVGLGASPQALANPPSVLGEPKRVRTVPIRPDQPEAEAAAPPRSQAAAPSPRQNTASAPVNEPLESSSPAAQARASVPPAPRAAAVPRQTQQPPASGNSPLSLVPDNGASMPAGAPIRTASTGGRGFHVQVASQRSEADAQSSYRSIQTKFSGVLGERQAVIRRADLGDKGTYYRALVGPFTTREQAIQLCGSLKAAGGDCVVQSN